MRTRVIKIEDVGWEHHYIVQRRILGIWSNLRHFKTDHADELYRNTAVQCAKRFCNGPEVIYDSKHPTNI